MQNNADIVAANLFPLFDFEKKRFIQLN
jgi:hypothetical protein